MRALYRSEPVFPYADGRFAVFPSIPVEERKQPEKGTFVFTDNYTIYFHEGTPEDIKTRLVKEYGEFYQRELAAGRL